MQLFLAQQYHSATAWPNPNGFKHHKTFSYGIECALSERVAILDRFIGNPDVAILIFTWRFVDCNEWSGLSSLALGQSFSPSTMDASILSHITMGRGKNLQNKKASHPSLKHPLDHPKHETCSNSIYCKCSGRMLEWLLCSVVGIFYPWILRFSFHGNTTELIFYIFWIYLPIKRYTRIRPRSLSFWRISILPKTSYNI